MKGKTVLVTMLTILLLSFTSDKNTMEFSYPKRKEATFIMNTNKFKKFKEEWRGQDYYYLCENGDGGFICSVLFYKLNENEQKMLVEAPQKILKFPESSPGYPLVYFSNNSNLKEFESNKQKWGDPSGDFMFSQSDIKEMQGFKVNQKNMNGYAMFGKDLFVNIHLSKIACTPEDSTVMWHILDGLVKKKQ